MTHQERKKISTEKLLKSSHYWEETFAIRRLCIETSKEYIGKLISFLEYAEIQYITNFNKKPTTLYKQINFFDFFQDYLTSNIDSVISKDFSIIISDKFPDYKDLIKSSCKLSTECGFWLLDLSHHLPKGKHPSTNLLEFFYGKCNETQYKEARRMGKSKYNFGETYKFHSVVSLEQCPLVIIPRQSILTYPYTKSWSSIQKEYQYIIYKHQVRTHQRAINIINNIYRYRYFYLACNGHLQPDLPSIKKLISSLTSKIKNIDKFDKLLVLINSIFSEVDELNSLIESICNNRLTTKNKEQIVLLCNKALKLEEYNRGETIKKIKSNKQLLIDETILLIQILLQCTPTPDIHDIIFCSKLHHERKFQRKNEEEIFNTHTQNIAHILKNTSFQSEKHNTVSSIKNKLEKTGKLSKNDLKTFLMIAFVDLNVFFYTDHFKKKFQKFCKHYDSEKSNIDTLSYLLKRVTDYELKIMNTIFKKRKETDPPQEVFKHPNFQHKALTPLINIKTNIISKKENAISFINNYKEKEDSEGINNTENIILSIYIWDAVNIFDFKDKSTALQSLKMICSERYNTSINKPKILNKIGVDITCKNLLYKHTDDLDKAIQNRMLPYFS